jgi:ADP-ribosylglycohydrolase
MATLEARSRYRGCLLGGAVGDALGAPVEFQPWTDIRVEFGPAGIRDFVPAYGRLGAITDDTQMTLFTAAGLLRARVRYLDQGSANPVASVGRAYLDWLVTQGERVATGKSGRESLGLLLRADALYAQRAPGITCLKALIAMDHPSDAPAANDSKGCGGVMRVAPCGMLGAEMDAASVFELARACGALTHGHPTGSLAAGGFAVLIHEVLQGRVLPEAIAVARALLVERPDHEETLAALDAAVTLAAQRATVTPGPAAVESLGGAWIAEEALAIAVYAALVAENFEHGVVLAVNHGGDSDSTGSMAGNLLGAIHGVEANPVRWLKDLELREVITQVADDLLTAPGWNPEVPGFVNVRKRWPGSG